MSNNLKLLEDKVAQVLERLDHLKGENTGLRQENKDLRRELNSLKQEFDHFRVDQNDRAEQVRTRLMGLLARIEDLEKIGL